jgi:hypothetical protein
MDIQINPLTAKPALELMLAAAGLEPSMLPVKESWDVFKRYLDLPSSCDEDLVSFQTEWIREGDAPTFAVRFVRQVTSGADTRAAAIEFLFEHMHEAYTEQDLWSRDFRRLDDFVSAVEDTRELRHVLDETPVSGMLVEEEP